MSDNGIVWEEPLNRGRQEKGRDGVWIRRLAPLLERPEAWARVLETDTSQRALSTAHNLRRGLVQRPAGAWQFTARTVRDDDDDRTPHYFVYARYLGPEEPA